MGLLSTVLDIFCPDKPEIRRAMSEGYPEGRVPICPVCGEECSTIYKDGGEIIGCNICIRVSTHFFNSRCPVCGSPYPTELYYAENTNPADREEAAGCDECLQELDADLCDECFPYDEDYDYDDYDKEPGSYDSLYDDDEPDSENYGEDW